MLEFFTNIVVPICTIVLAYLTYSNIKADRISRKIEKEKDLTVKILNNFLLLIEYVEMYKEKKQFVMEQSSNLTDSSNEEEVLDNQLKLSDTHLMTYDNKTQALLLELYSVIYLMPSQVKIILDSINTDVEEFEKNAENETYVGTLSQEDYSFYKRTIELNIKNILEDENFSLNKLKWKTSG